MKPSDAVKILKENTMACWWPSRILGRHSTDWAGIRTEIELHLLGIRHRQGIPDDAKFFVLDDSNPETALYDSLVAASMIICGPRVRDGRR